MALFTFQALTTLRLWLPLLKQLEGASRETTIDHLTAHTGFPDRVAEAIGRMCVTMIVDARAVDEVRTPVDPNRQVTARAGKPELALPARRPDDD